MGYTSVIIDLRCYRYHAILVQIHSYSQKYTSRNMCCVLRAADQQRAATESRLFTSLSILTVFLRGSLSLAAGYKLAIQLTLCLVRERCIWIRMPL